MDSGLTDLLDTTSVADDEPPTVQIVPQTSVRPAPAWGIRPYVVGDPGHAAAAVIERPARDFPDHHGTVLDGAAIRAVGHHPWTQVRGASVRGLTHRDDGTVRQDDYAFRQSEDDRYLVLAVADGVSAGVASHEGAGVAVRYACEVVEGWLRKVGPTEMPWQDVLRVVSDAVLQRPAGCCGSTR